jgi:hypothetical protein
MSRFLYVPKKLTSRTLTTNPPAPTGRYNPAKGNALGPERIDFPALKGRNNGNEEVGRTTGFIVSA